MTSTKKIAIFPVVIALLLALLSLVSSALGWFAVSNRADIALITTRAVPSETTIKISYDADHYYEKTLTLDTSKSYIIMPKALHQVSTTGKESLQDNGLFSFYNAIRRNLGDGVRIATGKDTTITSENGILSKSKNGTRYQGSNVEVDDPSYIAFDLYLDVDYDSDIYLYKGSEILSYGSRQTNIASAVRCAFIHLGTTDNTERELPIDATDEDKEKAHQYDTANALALNDVKNASVVIWEPDKEATTYGIGRTVYQSSMIVPYEYVDGFTDIQETYDSEDLKLDSKENYSKYTPIVSVKKGYSKIRVLIWLEGNDPDCTMDIQSGGLTIDLTFYSRRSKN